jgi:uncharacterized protein
VYGGILAVADPDCDPVLAYETLAGFSPPQLDFLIPLATRQAPHPREGAFGPWLTDVFDRWYEDDTQEIRIRIFDRIIRAAALGETRAPGADITATIVIESDGSIELTDSLKSAYDGAAATGLSVLRDSIADATEAATEKIAAWGWDTLPAGCSGCPAAPACGAWGTSTRWDGTSFAHPSVHCADISHLVRHVTARVRLDLAESAERKTR